MVQQNYCHWSQTFCYELASKFDFFPNVNFIGTSILRWQFPADVNCPISPDYFNRPGNLVKNKSEPNSPIINRKKIMLGILEEGKLRAHVARAHRVIPRSARAPVGRPALHRTIKQLLFYYMVNSENLFHGNVWRACFIERKYGKNEPREHVPWLLNYTWAQFRGRLKTIKKRKNCSKKAWATANKVFQLEKRGNISYGITQKES